MASPDSVFPLHDTAILADGNCWFKGFSPIFEVKVVKIVLRSLGSIRPPTESRLTLDASDRQLLFGRDATSQRHHV